MTALFLTRWQPRYVAKFMHQTGLLAQFQHAEQEESDDETGDREVI
jgi:hypothetical protein